MKTEAINIRDPFVLLSGGRYYLYGTRGPTCWGPADGFDVYVSEDLENWEGPKEIFHNDGSFWADRNYWAPEIHPWQGAFYMFASFKRPGLCRGTAILRSETPDGPFRPWSDGRVTPGDWECLDGTFYADEQGRPWMVFCHEWVQIGDGTVCAVPLTEDLRRAAGEAITLFSAADAPWAVTKTHSSGTVGRVTDGPFLWRTSDGELLCLWASFSDEGYTEGMARSVSGEVTGPWTQLDPLFRRDGGHGMVFRTKENTLMLTLHTPNTHLEENPAFYPLEEKEGRLVRVNA